MNRSWKDWSPLPLRIALGIGFVHHGWHNVIMPDERDAFLWMLSDMGIARPGLILWLISAVSFLGGLALLAGAFVRAVALPLLIHVPAILFIMHVPSGFDFVHLTAVTSRGPQYGMPGYEVSVLYAAGLMSLLRMGAGALSVDSCRAKRSRSRARRPAQGESGRASSGKSVGTFAAHATSAFAPRG
jgi:putative oxidoreductase